MSLPPALPAARARSPRFRALFILLAVGSLSVAAVIGVLAYRLSQPRWYMAQVTIETPWQESYNPPPPSNPMAQWDILRKPEVLGRVVDMLDLTQANAPSGAKVTRQDAIQTLARSLRIEVDPQTPRRARIEVYERDPLTPANIANSVAKVYRTLRLEEEQSQREASLAQYSAEVETQRASTRRAAEGMQRIGARDQVADPDSENPEIAVKGSETGAYLTAKQQYLQAKRILQNAEAALSKFRMEIRDERDPVRILERAEPAARPVPWWRGEPRG